MSANGSARIDPNQRLVWFVDYAIDAVVDKLYPKEKYLVWLDFAEEWKNGNRSPARCVDAAHKCFEHKGPTWHTLGQLAWGAKEACYDTPQSGWLVVRYIADAMVAFGVAFPELISAAPPLTLSLPYNTYELPVR